MSTLVRCHAMVICISVKCYLRIHLTKTKAKKKLKIYYEDDLEVSKNKMVEFSNTIYSYLATQKIFPSFI